MDSLWEKSIKIIKQNISKQNFETWIRPITIVSRNDNHIQLSVPNKFFKDWIMENYRGIIGEAVSSAAGTEIEFDLTISRNGLAATAAEATNSNAVVRNLDKAPPKRIHPLLNPNYTFERFVVGSCNQFAHAASMAVAEKPAKNYNPLFIYGGVGLGKTHLLNAIGFRTLLLYPGLNVLYVSAEEFMNELINSIRYDKMQKFRDKFRSIDCLLIDDIQFIAGKERTQEEFFHTFNTLHDSSKQIVVTSDKFPKDIPNLEGRLRSRFEWGLIADIQPPETETKMAIVEKKAQENGINIPSNAAYYICSHAESNIRELEGLLIRIGAYSSLTGREIDMDLVKEVLKKLLKHREKKEVTIDEVIKAVAGKLNVKIADIKSQNKTKNFVLSRQIAMYLSRKMTNASYPDIGERIGGRDHSTVIYAFNKMRKMMEEDNHLKQLVQEIEEAMNKE